MAKGFIDFIADSFNSDRGKDFLEIIKKPTLEAEELSKFFENAGYEIDKDKCKKLMEYREAFARDFDKDYDPTKGFPY